MAKRSKNPASTSENRRLAESEMRQSNSKKKSSSTKNTSSTTPLKLKKPAVKTVQDKRTMYDKMSFSKAFGAARKKALAGGDKTFYWKGKRYGTNLKKKASQTTPSPNVTAGLKAEQNKASNKAVKQVEQNIASSTQDKPKVQSSQVSFKSKSRLLANKPGQSSSVKARPSKTTTGKGATASNTNPADGKAFLSQLNSYKPQTQAQKNAAAISRIDARLKKLKGAGGKAIAERKKLQERKRRLQGKSTTTRKPYETKAGPAQPVAKPKAKPKAKKKSSGSAIGRFERGLVRGINRGIRKAKRAVRRTLK